MSNPPTPAFNFIDLFAGIGGFHAAMKAYGGECVYAVEIDKAAAEVYHRNWGHAPNGANQTGPTGEFQVWGDITKDSNDDRMVVPAHDILCAGFPCQPFSKSGAQRGMDEARGTLFWNIAHIIEALKTAKKDARPAIVMLENVRNIAGPRHEHEWDVIIETLRELGYHVAHKSAVFSPHLIPYERGGRPQVRERVFITATYDPDGHAGGIEAECLSVAAERFDLNPRDEWDIDEFLDPEDVIPGCELSEDEIRWIDAWDDFEKIMRKRMKGRHLPGHPIWADEWAEAIELEGLDWNDLPADFELPTEITFKPLPDGLPAWKRSHILKNRSMLIENKNWREILPWAIRHEVFTSKFPTSRRKLEWQAQGTERLWDTVMHLRPSGIRAKAPTYLPALVAITQTSIIGPRRRRISPSETARLQGLPSSFDFGDQRPASTYKQMGNGVNVGAVWHVLREHVRRDEGILKMYDAGKRICEAVLAEDVPDSPDERLAQHVPAKP